MTFPMSEAVNYNRLREERKRLAGELLIADGKLESVREFVLSRKYDIEMDIENFGMLKTILSYFLEEAEDL